MYRPLVSACFLVLGLLSPNDTGKVEQPTTTKKDVKERLHGVEISDPYRWLEQSKSPETRAWIKTQQDYTASVLDKLPGRDAIRKRLTELLRVDSMSAPTVRGDVFIFSRRKADQDQPVYYVRHGFSGEDKVLVDGNTLSKDGTISAVSLGMTEDGSIWAHGVRHGGEDETTIQLMDVATGKDLPDLMPKARYSVALKPDKSGFFYTRMNTSGPGVYYHALGTPSDRDVELFGKGYGPDKIISEELSEDGRYLVLTVHHGASSVKSEVYVKDVANDGPITPIVNDINARFNPQIGGDTLFMQTNWNAPNNRLLAVDLKEPAKDKWREVIPEAKSVMETFHLVDHKIYASYLENVSSRQRIYSADGKHLGDVKYPGIGTGGVSGRWGSKIAFFSFTSFVTPPSVYRYDPDKEEIGELWSRLDVPIDSDRFEVKQVHYRSKDGTEVPMFLVHRKGLKLDGNNPTFLTGYGGFNLSRTPAFDTTTAFWVESGGVYALPSLRGGGEFGEAWHKAGMLDRKQNVFDDFIGAAEWLIANHYTRPEKLAIVGGSNGGLLVGAALTQRPELFRAVVCRAPLLDMLRYQKFLVARFWVSEYGSAENPQQFKYLYAYSPYQHVEPGTKYPAVMFTTGDSDTRVDPLHARKMCAELQAATASGPERPILLHYDVKSGHSAGKPVRQTIEDDTDNMSFLFWQLGMTKDASN